MLPTRRVVLVDDHPIVLEGVEHLLSATREFQIVAEGQTAEEGLAVVKREQPDLVILDLRIGDALAPDLIEQLHRAAPGVKVIMFTAFDDDELLGLCLQQGAAGILLKDAHGLDLVSALRAVCDGQVVVDARIKSRALGQPRAGRSEDCGGYQRLTQREYQVLRLLSRGMTSREIGEQLTLAPNTVRSYIQVILGKLHAQNRVQAVAAARHLRLI